MEWKRRCVAGLAGLALAGCSTMGSYREIPTSSRSQEYRAGVATRSYESGSETVDKAKKAMDDVGIHSIQEVHERKAIVLEGRTTDDRRAVVSIATEGSRSVVTAKIGLLGDEALSRALMDRLSARVGEPSKSTPIVDADTRDEPKKPRRPIIAKEGVSDELMLRSQADAGYRDTPVP